MPRLCQVEESTETGEFSVASSLLSKAFAIIDKNVKRGILHKNTAARKKSQLHLKVTQPTPPPAQHHTHTHTHCSRWPNSILTSCCAATLAPPGQEARGRCAGAGAGAGACGGGGISELAL